MRKDCSISFSMRTILGCCALFVAQSVASQDWPTNVAPPESGAAIEAHRLTLGRQFVLFNQVLFGGEESPQLSIRYAYDPQHIQRWILNSDERDRLELLAAIAKQRNDVMIIPPIGSPRRSSPFQVSVDRPSALATHGQYEIIDGYAVSVPESGPWSIIADNDPVSLGDGVPELVFDLQMAISNKALIGLDTKIKGLQYESFVIEGPLVPRAMSRHR